MRNIKLMYLAVALIAILTSNSLWAHNSHSHSYYSIGLDYYGSGFYGGYGYGGYGFGRYGWGGYGYPFYYPLYYYPPTVIMPTKPPVYIQQAQPVQPQTSYWYYCQDPDGYYPYVRNCPGGWLQVAPQPPGQ